MTTDYLYDGYETYFEDLDESKAIWKIKYPHWLDKRIQEHHEIHGKHLGAEKDEVIRKKLYTDKEPNGARLVKYPPSWEQLDPVQKHFITKVCIICVV